MAQKNIIGTSIDRAVELLRAGEVIGVPTETVYGLAGNALDEHAASQIFAVKERPSFDPLIVHVGDVNDIERYVQEVPSILREIMDDHMPGPITVLLQRSEVIPDLITAGLDRVAIRIPAHPMMRELLGRLDFPLAAPSANPFGYISPTTAQHVVDQLGAKIPYVLDGGACMVGVESTIVGVEQGRLTVYRKGGLPIEILREYDDRLKVNIHSDSNPGAPGMLKSHYAPSCGIELVTEYDSGDGIGAITFGETVDGITEEYHYDLSPSRDYQEAARNLFKAMRYLDSLGLFKIQVKLLPEKYLGVAINDRLRRAAAE